MKALNNKGLTLVELIVGIALVAIAGTTLFYGFVASGRIHLNTTELQMAEDVAQYISEEFKTHSVEWLESQYGSYLTFTDNGITDEYLFTGVPYEYSVRSSTNPSAKFTADVTLTTKLTATDEEARDTTYKQNDKDNYFAIAPKTGTNTFIVPEVKNIYDGKSVVVSEDLNEFDSSVVSNLYNAIQNYVVQKNAEWLAANPLAQIVDLNSLDAAFSAKFYPLSNMYSDSSTDVEKNTSVEIVEKVSGAYVKYYYIVDTEYVFKFDFPVLLTNGTSTSYVDLKDLMPSSFDAILAVGDSQLTYKITRTNDEYTVKYEAELDSADTGSLSEKGTFAGPIVITDSTGAEILCEWADADASVPYLYFLYNPFNVYSDSKNASGDYVANDNVTFSYSGAGKKIARVFLVVQDSKHAVDVTEDVYMKNCTVSSGDFLTQLQVFTNSSEIIENSSTMHEVNYLTNSYGKSNANLYDLKIVVKDQTGKVVAEINTVKED